MYKVQGMVEKTKNKEKQDHYSVNAESALKSIKDRLKHNFETRGVSVLEKYTPLCFFNEYYVQILFNFFLLKLCCLFCCRALFSEQNRSAFNSQQSLSDHKVEQTNSLSAFNLLLQHTVSKKIS